jgi:predicted nucleic acid-binding protein
MTIFSLDSNVLIALWDDTDALSVPACQSLARASTLGRLNVSAPVYSELMGHPSRSVVEIDSFLTGTGIDIEWDMEQAIWRTAGVAFQRYVQRRLANKGQLPRRILTDFLIGAHAVVRGYTLLTLDKRLYLSSFPGIRIESF